MCLFCVKLFRYKSITSSVDVKIKLLKIIVAMTVFVNFFFAVLRCLGPPHVPLQNRSSSPTSTSSNSPSDSTVESVSDAPDVEATGEDTAQTNKFEEVKQQ